MHHVSHAPEQRPIPRNIYDMGAWRNDRVAEQCWISAEERHDITVAEYMLVLVPGVPAKIRADKARSSSRPFNMRGKIKFHHRHPGAVFGKGTRDQPTTTRWMAVC